MSPLVVVVVRVLLVVKLLTRTYIWPHIHSQTLRNVDFPRHTPIGARGLFVSITSQLVEKYMSLLVVVVLLLRLVVPLPKWNYILPHIHSQTLRNVTAHPGRGARGLLSSIISRFLEKLMSLLVVVAVLVLLVVKPLNRTILWPHKHTQTLSKRQNSSRARFPRITFEYYITICTEINVVTCRSSNTSTSRS